MDRILTILIRGDSHHVYGDILSACVKNRGNGSQIDLIDCENAGIPKEVTQHIGKIMRWSETTNGIEEYRKPHGVMENLREELSKIYWGDEKD